MNDGLETKEQADQAEGKDKNGKKPVFRLTPAELRKMLWAAGVFVGVGGYLAATVLVTAYAGDWCDGKLGTAPAGRVIGLIAGFPLAVWSLYEQYKNFDKY